MAMNVLFDELNHIFTIFPTQWSGFSPLGEVFDCHKDEVVSVGPSRVNRANEGKPPNLEWPISFNWM